jgi:type II secretory pathway pseudopilin PulG
MVDDLGMREGHSGSTAGDAAGDSGFTLVEVIVTTLLMSTAVLSILLAMWTAIRVSTLNDDQAKVEAVLGSAADRLANYKYLACPGGNRIDGGYLPIVQAAAGTVGWPGDSVAITDIRYWNPSTTSTGSWSSTNNLASAECAEGIVLTTSKTLQLVTIQVTSPDSGYTRDLEVVMNNVRAKPIT